MSRAKYLDEIAPDNPVIPIQESPPSSPPPPPKSPSSRPQKNTPISHEFRQKAYDILGHTRTPFSSFLVRPKVFTFDEKDVDEEIILVLRRHWITNLSWIFITIVMIYAPSFLRYIPLLESFPPTYQFVAVLFWYLITFAFAFEQFLTWYFNVYIITDERVVDIDFNNLLIKKFTEAKLSMIQDVTSHIVGVSQTMFNYGDIRIQTAAEIPEIIFDKVSNPQKIIKALHQLRQEEEQETLEGRVK